MAEVRASRSLEKATPRTRASRSTPRPMWWTWCRATPLMRRWRWTTSVATVESACNRSCAGQQWVDIFLESLNLAPGHVRDLVSRVPEAERFKFGNGGTLHLEIFGGCASDQHDTFFVSVEIPLKKPTRRSQRSHGCRGMRLNGEGSCSTSPMAFARSLLVVAAAAAAQVCPSAVAHGSQWRGMVPAGGGYGDQRHTSEVGGGALHGPT